MFKIMSFILRLFYLSSQIALTWYIFYIYCHWPKYSCSGTPVTCYLLIFGKLVVNPVHFLLPEIIQRDNQGIIVYFNYLIQNITPHRLLWFVCRLSNMLLQCLKIESVCVFEVKLGKGSVNPAFIFKTLH
jgi:hypothetical protein